MKRTLALTLLITLLLTLLVASHSARGKPQVGGASRSPNILFILTDQHHANTLSSAGNPYLKTRALDAMAKSGIRFTNAYVTNPVCVPSRISMATGRMAESNDTEAKAFTIVPD